MAASAKKPVITSIANPEKEKSTMIRYASRKAWLVHARAAQQEWVGLVTNLACDTVWCMNVL